MSEKRVFISYSHDSEEHREKVLALSERLRADGIETILDQYVNGSPTEGWPRWMLNGLDAADSVIVVCTETYYRRFRGHEEPGKGKGVDWEDALITQEIYDRRSRTLKFVPVFLGTADEKWIPDPLRSGAHYPLTSESAYRGLYDFLLGQSGVEAGPVGALKLKPRRKGAPLTFDEAPEAETPKIDIFHFDVHKYAPADLIGCEAETKVLADAWDRAVRGEPGRPHVLTFVALGGEGKTSLVAKWAAELAHQGWLGCDAVFAWSFYSQGTREQTAVSSDAFLAAALTFFGDAAMAGSAQGAFDKGRRLAQLVGERRALLVLDGVEPLQYAPASPTAGELKDPGLGALLKGLVARNRGLCVVTSRYSIVDLKAFWQTTAPEVKLARLSLEAGIELLELLGVKGSRKGFEKLVEEVKGHALTLNLLGAYLRDAYAGDIRKRDRVKLEEADAEEQGGHAFRVMDAYVNWFEGGGDKGKRALSVLRLMGLFDRPADAGCLQALLKVPAIPDLTESLIGMKDAQRNLIFKRLEDARLLTVNRDQAGTLLSLDAHPLLREYLAGKLRTQASEAWRAAHRRLYEHLCEVTPYKDEPTLEDLQPLYQAVAHGCQAGMQREAREKVYEDRILNGTGSNGFYSWKKLGATGADLGAVACFFEEIWSRVSAALAEVDQAWVLNEAALRLRGLGRLNEAIEPMRAGLENYVKQENWKDAAQVASNLSELELTLGEVVAAVSDAEDSVSYAERSGDAFHRMGKRTTHADALHQAGRRDEAHLIFREAETLQAERQPDYPLLNSVRGFRYCDLLLANTERAAWQRMLDASVGPCAFVLNEPCRAVSERVGRTLKIAEQNNWLLDIGLDHLTLFRATIYTAILEKISPDSCVPDIEQAVDGLRRASRQDYLPRGLLTRAWLRFLQSNTTGADSAQSDLDEALEIAERGPMPLFIADILLHRARNVRPDPSRLRPALSLGLRATRPRRSPPPDRKTRLPAPQTRTRRCRSGCAPNSARLRLRARASCAPVPAVFGIFMHLFQHIAA